MENRNSLLDRLIKVKNHLKERGIASNQKEMAQLLGMSNSALSDAFHDRNRKLTIGLMQRIADTFPDEFYEKWLLKGEGDMARKFVFEVDSDMANGYAQLIRRVYAQKNPYRPHIEAKAAAGFMSEISDGEYGDDLRPLIPGVADYDFSITAYGKSMEPKIEDNDVLACRIVTDSQNPPIGKICVIDSKDGAAVKVIKGIEEDYIILHSLNPKYKDYRVAFSDLNQIAIVVGSVRNF